jgi:CBS-domain-containing membrane protein
LLTSSVLRLRSVEDHIGGFGADNEKIRFAVLIPRLETSLSRLGDRKMRAHQIMTRQVITMAIDAPIVDAANSMLRNHISGLPVVDEAGRLVGIISQGDFIRRAEIGTQRKRGRWLKFLVTAKARHDDREPIASPS